MAYRIDGNKLEVLRGKLIQKLGRDVSWSEFAHITGVSLTTLSNIRHDRSGGSGQTGQQVIDSLAKQGILVSHEDLISANDAPRRHPNKSNRKREQVSIAA